MTIKSQAFEYTKNIFHLRRWKMLTFCDFPLLKPFTRLWIYVRTILPKMCSFCMLSWNYYRYFSRLYLKRLFLRQRLLLTKCETSLNLGHLFHNDSPKMIQMTFLYQNSISVEYFRRYLIVWEIYTKF